MRRRWFISLIGSAVIWPPAVSAQQSVMPVLGFLHSGSAEGRRGLLAAFFKGLQETGFNEGQNVRIEYRWAAGNYDQLPSFARELVQHQVSALAALGGTFVGLAAKRETSTIPIIFVGTGDPVSLGLVPSLNRPAGNVTGVVLLAIELLGKRVELLRELFPNDARIAVLVNPTNPSHKVQLAELERTALSLSEKIIISDAGNERELDGAFSRLSDLQAHAVLISSDAFFYDQRNKIAALSVRYAVPAVSELRDFAEAGGLMSYGTSYTEAYRQAGIYTGRILKGEKPANLPVQQSTKVELVINLKSAKTLGITVPPALLARADEVIE